MQGTAPVRPARRRPGDAWFYLGFALAVAVFLAMAVATYRGINEFTESVRRVERSQQVIANLDSLMVAVVTLESRQRAYLLSEDPEFLLSYTDMMADIHGHLATLESQTADDPRARAAFAALKELVTQKQDRLLDAALRQSNERADLTLRQSAAQSEAIRFAIAGMREDAQSSQASLSANMNAYAARYQRLIVFGNTAGVALLLVAGAMFVRGARVRARVDAERQRAEDALRESEKRYRTLFESMDQGFCVVEMIPDAEGEAADFRFVEVNPAFEKHTGLAGALGKTVRQVVPELDRHWFEIYGKVARTGVPVRFEQPADAMQRAYDVFAFRIDPAGRHRVGVLFADVTERRRAHEATRAAAEAAQAANHAKSTFLGVMSHEIRTPLVGMLGMVEVLARSQLGGEQRRQLNIIHQSAHSLLRIIGDILDFSKVEAGKLEMQPATVSLRERISRVIGNFSAAAESKGLALVLDYDPAVAAAHVVDGTLLAQILGNWVSNAIKFTERGVVTVRARVADQTAGAQTLVISVVDTGIGITAPKLARLFEPFTQGDTSTTRRYGGTGLGLAITARLAKLLGGTIHAESTPGLGTVMSLKLSLPMGNPAEIEQDSVEEPASGLPCARPLPTREEAQREGSLVLLAEDHPTNRMVLKQMLAIVGIAVDLAEDGQQALDMFRSGRYGLVLTDLHMPKLSGLELAAAIRAHERAYGAGRTPIIALTANVQREQVEHCLAAGMDEHLPKPITMRQLSDKLKQWMPGVGWHAEPQALAATPGVALPVDERTLQELASAGGGSARDILRMFCEVTTGDIAVLGAGPALAEPGVIKRAAHSIKGAAGMVGASDLSAAAARLEIAARDGNLEQLGALVAALHKAFLRVKEHVAMMTGEASAASSP